MDRLKAMETYVRVVRDGSFAAAADHLGLSRAIVTKHVMQLEKQLGARLINRTTRRFSVTEIGQSYFDFCLRVLDQMAEQDALVARLQEEPRGEVKVMAPKSFGSLYLGSIVSDFTARYPEIRITLILSDISMKGLDLVENGFDLAIRLSAQADSSLVAKRIGALRWMPCAAPAYLARHGEPAAPGDLARHNCLLHTKCSDSVWRLNGPTGEVAVKVAGTIVTNSVMVLQQATLNGLGIALLPTYCIGPDLATGNLRQILKDYAGPDESIYVIYPHRQLLATKVRLFIDFLAERIQAAPWDMPPAAATAPSTAPAVAPTRMRSHARRPAARSRSLRA